MSEQIIFGSANTVYFPLITAAGTDFQTTWSPAAGEAQYIGDGGTATNLGSNPVHEGNGIWSQALTIAESSFGIVVLTYSDGATDIEDQAIICNTQFSGQIESNKSISINSVNTASVAATAIKFESDKLSPSTTEEATTDHYLSRNILFTSGPLLGEMKPIIGYSFTNSREDFDTQAFTGAPSNGDRFVIL